MSPRTRPRRLRRGDTVAVVSPAGPISADSLAAGVAVLRGWGLNVVTGAHLLDRHPRLSYLAGTDQDRADDLMRAWCDPEVAAVVCARGGYGCLRIVDLLDWDAMAAAGPKLFTGSSDVTALHEVIADRLGLVTLFTPMVAGPLFLAELAAQEHLRATVFDPGSVTVLGRGEPDPIVPGRASGVTAGGNLSLLAAAIGSAPPPAEGTILLLEDVTEPPYRLDRMLTQLRRSGYFAGVSGIALGSWAGCGPIEQLREMLADRLGDLGVPVAWELGFGHCAAQLSMPLGVAAELDATAGTLTLSAPALH